MYLLNTMFELCKSKANEIFKINFPKSQQKAIYIKQQLRIIQCGFDLFDKHIKIYNNNTIKGHIRQKMYFKLYLVIQIVEITFSRKLRQQEKKINYVCPNLVQEYPKLLILLIHKCSFESIWENEKLSTQFPSLPIPPRGNKLSTKCCLGEE